MSAPTTLARAALTTLLALALLAAPGPRRVREARPVRPASSRLTRLTPRPSAGEAQPEISREVVAQVLPRHRDTASGSPEQTCSTCAAASPWLAPVAVAHPSRHDRDIHVRPGTALLRPPLRAPPVRA